MLGAVSTRPSGYEVSGVAPGSRIGTFPTDGR
jgi:hypothetical protein